MKPSFFKNEDLADLPPLTRLMFQGMWCVADRNGRLENRPRRIKIECLPYDEHDVETALVDLERSGFINCYRADDLDLIEITNFSVHQNPHPNEASVYPANPHGCREQLQEITDREMQPLRARESVLGVRGKELVKEPLPAARAGDLGDTLRALEEIWPVERCRPTDSGQRERELFQKHRTGDLPETVTDDAREYLAAHGFGDGHVSGCPNLHRWINEARWIDPLPVKAGRPAPAPIDNTPLTADELREYEQIMAEGDAA